MRNDNSGWCLIVFMIVLLITAVMFTAVLCSDMPTWAKWLILTQ